mmetsp:Transcript_16599/g.39108  ORF Transcript_16599/g.39108 Transcript_16599/m.39108 type:complete len:115 (+) Transcript_16599:672-1016(+)
MNCKCLITWKMLTTTGPFEPMWQNSCNSWDSDNDILALQRRLHRQVEIHTLRMELEEAKAEADRPGKRSFTAARPLRLNLQNFCNGGLKNIRHCMILLRHIHRLRCTQIHLLVQ